MKQAQSHSSIILAFGTASECLEKTSAHPLMREPTIGRAPPMADRSIIAEFIIIICIKISTDVPTPELFAGPLVIVVVAESFL